MWNLENLCTDIFYFSLFVLYSKNCFQFRFNLDFRVDQFLGQFIEEDKKFSDL